MTPQQRMKTIQKQKSGAPVMMKQMKTQGKNLTQRRVSQTLKITYIRNWEEDIGRSTSKVGATKKDQDAEDEARDDSEATGSDDDRDAVSTREPEGVVAEEPVAEKIRSEMVFGDYEIESD